MLVNKKTSKGKYISKRTQPLLRLPQAIRLRTMEVYIQESEKAYMRRNHEPSAVIRYMKDITHRHANMRLFRSFRTLQGLDTLMAMRGMKYIRFWDFSLWLDKKTLQVVRDHSFLSDLNSNVTRKPHPEEEASRNIRRLERVPDSYGPTEDDYQFVIQALREARPLGGQSLPTPSPTPDRDSSDSPDSEDSDSDDASDDGGNDDDQGSDDGHDPFGGFPHGFPTPESGQESPDPEQDVDMGDMADNEDGGDDDDGNDGHALMVPGTEVKTETEAAPGINADDSSDDDVKITGFRPIIHDLTQGGSAEEAIMVDGDEDVEGNSGDEPSLFLDDDDPEETQSLLESPPPNDHQEQGPIEPETPLATGRQSDTAVRNGHTGSPTSPDGAISESLFVSPGTQVSSAGARSPAASIVPPITPGTFETPQRALLLETSPVSEEGSLFLGGGSASTSISPEAASTTSYGPGIFGTPPQSQLLGRGSTSMMGRSSIDAIIVDGDPSENQLPPSTPVPWTPARGIWRRSRPFTSISPTEQLQNLHLGRVEALLPRPRSNAQRDPNVVDQREPHSVSPFWRTSRSTSSGTNSSESPKRTRESSRSADVEMGAADDAPPPKRPREDPRRERDEDEDAAMA